MLLILGNGFDLTCGLESRYEDFFKVRYNTVWFQALKALIEQNGLPGLENDRVIFYEKYGGKLFSSISIWDFVFMFENLKKLDSGWANIEHIIYEYIVNNTLNYINFNLDKNKLDNRGSKYYDIYQLIGYFFFKKQLSFSQLQYNEWLLSQLNIIEKDFAEYIKLQVKNHDNYQNDANELFDQLLSVKRSLKQAVISFNYTEPKLYNDYYAEKGRVSNITNVHGTVSGEVIFGIDEKDMSNKEYINPTESKYLFTKTARRFFNKDRDNFFYLNKEVDAILIYGHSLNDQDYSYFQSIFDFYSIYSSNIKLYFCYTIYDKRVKVRANIVSGAIRLLKLYGDTMSNKDNGRNLLHKMLLEKRIIIKEISR